MFRPFTPFDKPTVRPQGASPAFGNHTSKFAQPSEPDLPADDRDDADLDDAAFGISLEVDESEAADEDETSLQIPLDLQEPTDTDDEQPVELSLGQLIQTGESGQTDLSDTEPLADFDGRISNLEIELPVEEDAEDKSFEIELSDRLPELDGDDSPDSGPLAASEADTTLGDSEPAAGAPWLELEPRLEVACEAVDTASSLLLCGGQQLFSRADDESGFISHELGPLSCIALCAIDRERSLLISSSSSLHWARLSGGALRISAQLDARRTLSHLRPSQIQLGAFGAGRVMLLAGDGLFEITGPENPEIEGASLRMTELGLRAKRVLAIPRRSERFWSLVEEGERPALWRGVDGVERLDEIRLGGPAQWVGSGEEPRLAARASTVALSAFGRGLVVSCDDGKTFQHVSGCAGTTAIAIGLAAGTARVFAALYSEVRALTTLVEVDPVTGRATAIAQVMASAAEDDDSAGSPYIASLAFNDVSGTLIAVGEFGAKRWRSTQ